MQPDNNNVNGGQEPLTDNAGSSNITETPDPDNMTPSQPYPSQQVTPSPVSTETGKKGLFSKIGKTQAIIIGAIFLLVGGAAVYFGVVVPNKPENVWASALVNTGKGLDKLSEYVDKNKDLKGVKVDGNFKLETEGTVVDGSFEGKQYEKNANLRADIGAAGGRVNLEVLSNVPENADYPDIYMKVQGLSSFSAVLGADSPELSEFIASIDNQWYVLDHTAFEQLSKMATNATQDETPQLSADDILAIQKVVSDVSREYVFTDDPSKSVLEIAEVVGNEDINGTSTIHYKAKINKENLKAYVTKLKDELKNTKLGELYSDPSFEEAIAFDDLIKSIDKIEEGDTFDVWVDKSMKIIRKIEFSESKDGMTSRLEFLVKYDGGSNYPFELGAYSEEGGKKTSMVIGLELNTESNKTSLGFKLNEGEELAGEFSASVEPNNENVEFAKPDDAKSVYELIGLFGGGSSLGASTDLPVFSDVQPSFDF